MNQWVLLSNNEGIGDRMTTIKSDCHIIRGALYCSYFTLLPVLGMHCVQSSFPVRAISSPFSYSTRVEYRVFDQRNFRGRICRRGIMGGAVSLDFGGGGRAGGGLRVKVVQPPHSHSDSNSTLTHSPRARSLITRSLGQQLCCGGGAAAARFTHAATLTRPRSHSWRWWGQRCCRSSSPSHCSGLGRRPDQILKWAVGQSDTLPPPFRDRVHSQSVSQSISV